MKRVIAVFSIMFLSLTAALAEPLVLEQAGNVSKPKTLELGLGEMSYQFNLSEFNDKSKLTNTATTVSVYSRYTFSEKIEGTLNIPYRSIAFKSEPAAGASTTVDDSGLADLLAMLKYNCCACDGGWAVSAGLGLSLPTGKQSTKITEGFRNGLNLKPLLLATKNYGKYTANLNLSYNITAEYEDSSAAKTKHNPGDILSFGAGIEYPRGEKLNLIGEFVYNSISEATTGGIASNNSAGSQMDIVCGIRYNKNSMKTKLGVALSLGDEKNRDYDYKIIAGLTYLWEI